MNSSQKYAPPEQRGTFVPTSLPLGVLVGVVIIVAAALLAYLPSLNGGFIWDDRDLLTNSPIIKASDGLYRIWCTTEVIDYWPVTYTTFWIEWRLWGMNPIGYHLSNLILHIIESLLVWLILRKLSIPGAFLAAIIFVVHPVNVETVAWIAQRKNLMAMLFFLLSILCYIKFIIRARLRLAAKQSTYSSFIPQPSSLISHLSSLFYWLSLAAFVLAMLGKGSVAVLPVLLLGIVWWIRPLTRWDLARIAPFFLVAVVLSGVNVWFQTHGEGEAIRTAGFVERLLGAGGVVWFYLYKALLPVDLAFVYPQWHIQVGNPLWWLPLLAALVVTALLWRYRMDWSRPLLFAWGYFCVALLPVMGLTDVYFMKYSLVADHYQHIALVGVVALASAGWSNWRRQTGAATYWAATVVAVATVCTLTFLTRQQSGLYSDEIVLYQDTLKKNPECWMAHNNLGMALGKINRLPEAIERFRRALQIRPRYPEAYNNLGLALAQTGRLQQAIEHFERALTLKPEYPEAHNNLGVVLVQTGRPLEAIEHYERALALNSLYSNAQKNLGIALVQIGRPPQAIEHFEQALALKPDDPEAHNNLGKALVQAGRPQQAIEHYEQALTLKPDYFEAHYNLALVLAQSRRTQEAVEHYQRALALKPELPEAHNNLGVALAVIGRTQEAIEHFKQALRIKPDDISIYNNLSSAYASKQQSSEAIAAAQKALELAWSQGQTAEAKRIENWLNSYRAGHLDRQSTPSSREPGAPPP